MSPIEIVEAVLAAGGELVINGDRILYQIPEQAAPLLDELRRHKPDVLHLLRRQSLAHLLPFLGKRVWSPAGPGKLLAVEDYVTVGFDDGTKMRWYVPTAVIPYA
jgi:hypothetical protein